MAHVDPDYTKWWSATESGAFIHLDNEDIGFSSLFLDNDEHRHRAEDAVDEAGATVNFSALQDWRLP
jgi:hypothetical protein